MAYSKKQLAEYTREASECFAYHDAKHKGKLPAKDLLALMQSMGQYPTPAEAQSLLGGRQEFDLKAFLEMLRSHQKNSTMFEDELKAAFKHFDADGDGTVSAKEITHAVTVMGHKLSKKQAQAFVREADTDGSGAINYIEFVSLMTSGRSTAN